MFQLPSLRRLFRLPIRTARTAAAEVDSELQFHLEMRVAELMALGKTEAEARAEALRRFGDVAEARATLAQRGAIQARRAWRIGWLSDLGQDVVFALRGLRRRPGFAAVAVATVGLGIGLTTTVLAVVNRLVLHPLPYPGADRLSTVALTKQESGIQISPTLEMLEAWKAAAPDREWIGAHTDEELLLESGETAELVATRSVTPGLLPALGARLALGHGIEEGDAVPGAPLVTLLAYGTWQRRFGGSRDALGKTVRLDGRAATVIGVLGRGFDLTPLDGGARAEFWLPLTGGAVNRERSASIVLRRRPGVSVASATESLRGALKAAGQSSGLLQHFQPTAFDQSRFADEGQEQTLWLLTLAVSLVLAVACANVAALLLGQSAARGQEFGVRAALGAGRGRVVRQLITEAGVIGVLGGGAGFGIALLALRLTQLSRPSNLLALDDVTLESRVMLLAIAITLTVAILFGAAPAWTASRRDGATLVGRIRRSFDTRFGRSFRGVLVAGQLAASLVLLSGSGLLLRSFLRERDLPVGFQPKGLGWVRIDISSQLVPEPAVREALAVDAVAAVAAMPGIAAAIVTGDAPLGYGIMEGEFLVEGRPVPAEAAKSLMPIRMIGAGYFETIGMRLEAGRPLDGTPGSTEVVIDGETAQRLWPNGNAVGSRVRFSRESTEWHTVVGVAPEQRALLGAFLDAPFLFTAMPSGERGRTLIVRGRDGNPLERVSAVIRGVDSRIRIRSVVTAESALDERLAGRRFTMRIVTGFAGLALLLAAVGLYGVVALAVSQRTYELGVRMALGAAPYAVRAMVLREGVGRIAIGLGAGFVLVLALSRVLRSLLTDIAVWDPVVWLGAALVLAAAGILACWVPARRASRIDPLIALRSD